MLLGQYITKSLNDITHKPIIHLKLKSMTRQNSILFFSLRDEFIKAQKRLEKAIATGRFSAMSYTKKQGLLQRINRYAKQLGTTLKPGIVAAFVAAGLFISAAATAQSFTEITGAANPLNAKNVADTRSKPCFVDIDNDGDKDLFAGRYYSDEVKFINSGTIGAAVFGSGTTVNFNGQMNAAPAFVDIDNDGDKDMFVGKDNGTIYFYPNTGTAAAVVFPNYPVDLVTLPGYLNPLTGIDVVNNATPVFADIDNDGDKDCFIGNDQGLIFYYKNTGTAASPVFSIQAGAANPFNGVDVGTNAVAAIADVDKDGDLDAVIGNAAGSLLYFKNTGTAGAPVFAQQAGAANPFNGITITGGQAAPAFVDIDNDTDMDLFSGRNDGGFQFFQNTSALPIHWQSFSAQKYGAKQVLLKWTTLMEINSGDFLVEHSADGNGWKSIGTVQAKGNSSVAQEYSFTDPTPGNINYYRLKQRDLDGGSTYSEISIVRFKDNENSFTVLATRVANGVLQVQLNSNTVLSVLNSNGQLLLQDKYAAGSLQLQVGKFPAGVYFLKGNEQTERFIIQ
jgi:hypothetical protein